MNLSLMDTMAFAWIPVPNPHHVVTTEDSFSQLLGMLAADGSQLSPSQEWPSAEESHLAQEQPTSHG